MTIAMLIHNLLSLFAHNPRVHWTLTAYYQRQQPGMSDTYWLGGGYSYPGLVRYMIHAYPHAMQSCIAHLPRDWNVSKAMPALNNTCP